MSASYRKAHYEFVLKVCYWHVEYRTAHIHANDKLNSVNEEEDDKYMKEDQPQ